MDAKKGELPINKQSLIPLKKSTYLNFIIFLAPLLNFLSGINMDIYSPAMPAIAIDLNTTIFMTKNTITIMLVGFSIGAVFFGTLIDTYGRKNTLFYGITLYILANLAAPLSHTIHELMLIRFIQGFTIATISVGCRALVIDNITGPRYNVAILYTTLAYGLGPILGPFIGSLLQHYIGWHAIFLFLAFLAATLLVILTLFVKESIPKKQTLSLKRTIQQYFNIIRHRYFIIGTLIAAIASIELLLYPTLGPFIVENTLNYSILVYGNTALLVGMSYFSGTLLNRFLLKILTPRKICDLGFLIALAGVALSYCFALFFKLSLTTVLLPLILIDISCGFIYSALMGTNLKLFPETPALSAALFIASNVFFSSIGIFMITHIRIHSLSPLSYLYSIIICIELTLFLFYRKVIK